MGGDLPRHGRTIRNGCATGASTHLDRARKSFSTQRFSLVHEVPQERENGAPHTALMCSFVSHGAFLVPPRKPPHKVRTGRARKALVFPAI